LVPKGGSNEREWRLSPLSLIEERVTMFNRARKYVSGTRAALAGAVVCGSLVLSLGIAVPSSSAFGSSKFCKTILTYETKYASKAAAPTTLKDYKAWAKFLLPFYETLASEAPNDASKATLNEVVKILKYESTDSSIPSLEKYIGANSVKFDNGAKTLGKDIAACA
jgi:hypothetical protein